MVFQDICWASLEKEVNEMNRIFFIDMENVWERGLESAGKLKTTDKIILFHGHQRGRVINEAVHQRLAQFPGRVEYIPLRTRVKNAMDFEICTYIGYLVGKYGTGEEYIIVSEDKGYVAAVEFIRTIAPDVKIRRIESTRIIADAAKVRERISELLEGESRKVVKIATEALMEEEDLKAYHNRLNSMLRKTGSDVYKRTKDFYCQYHFGEPGL